MTARPESGRARPPDVAIVGGGLVGCLCARALADRGARVVVLEREPRLGARASSAAAGLLSPQMEAAEGLLIEAADPGAPAREAAMLDLCLAAREGWAAFARALEAETGRAVGYRADGTLVVAADGPEADALAARAAAQAARGLRAEWLDGPAARALEPALAPASPGALHLPDDHQVDPLALVAAVAAALALRPAVEVRTGIAVRGLAVREGRVAGVETAAGTVAAETVVVAAGAWSAGLSGLPRPSPVRPVKGQMAALRPEPMPFRRVVGGRGVYCVPRDDGRVLVGATVESAGFDETVDPEAVAALVAAAAAVVPALGRADVVGSWAGLRPGTADDLPIVGADPEVAGLLWATGHYRNGILLGPLTAEWIAALAEGAAPPVDPHPFRPGRE